MRTLLLGMGNPFLSDDAIGVRLAADFKAAVRELSADPSVEQRRAPRWGIRRDTILPLLKGRGEGEGVSQTRASTRSAIGSRQAARVAPQSELDILEECSVGGINLLEILCGYERVIVLDSLQTSGGTPGAWHRFSAEALRETAHLTNIHDANFATALELGRRISLPLPDDAEIHIFAVEIQDNRTFSEAMTPALEQAYPRLKAAIFKGLRECLHESNFLLKAFRGRQKSLPVVLLPSN